MLAALATVLWMQLASPDEPLTAPAPYVEGRIPSTGRADPRLTAFDQTMRDFLRKGEIPGATLAVTKDGRLIYSRGFGYADLANQVPMQPDALLRIASLSKPITAAMVMWLVQENKLKLDDFLLKRLDPRLHGGRKPADKRWLKITLDQLLRHRAGFDRALSGDPVFRPFRMGRLLGLARPARARDVIRAVLREPLDFAPGSRFAYSNFGYSLLGRVIEHATGLPYENAVRKHLLQPLGIRRMSIGHTLRSDRAKGEVVYHSNERGKAVVGKDIGKETDAPYGVWSQPDFDSFGGWIASAPELLRFSRLFKVGAPPEIFSAQTIAKIFSHDNDDQPTQDTPPWYAYGWEVRSHGGDYRTAWHMGSLPGTASLWVMRADGLSWVVLFNARLEGNVKLQGLSIDGELHRAAGLVAAWPEFDLYEKESEK